MPQKIQDEFFRLWLKIYLPWRKNENRPSDLNNTGLAVNADSPQGELEKEEKVKNPHAVALARPWGQKEWQSSLRENHP